MHMPRNKQQDCRIIRQQVCTTPFLPRFCHRHSRRPHLPSCHRNVVHLSAVIEQAWMAGSWCVWNAAWRSLADFEVSESGSEYFVTWKPAGKRRHLAQKTFQGSCRINCYAGSSLGSFDCNCRCSKTEFRNVCFEFRILYLKTLDKKLCLEQFLLTTMTRLNFSKCQLFCFFDVFGSINPSRMVEKSPIATKQ